jgi:hypothetical protein
MLEEPRTTLTLQAVSLGKKAAFLDEIGTSFTLFGRAVDGAPRRGDYLLALSGFHPDWLFYSV